MSMSDVGKQIKFLSVLTLIVYILILSVKAELSSSFILR